MMDALDFILAREAQSIDAAVRAFDHEYPPDGMRRVLSLETLFSLLESIAARQTEIAAILSRPAPGQRGKR